ncbi:MAG: hypothetical protein HY541_04355 [Deltaproteobacteria bacterium]|nr:hypothetical protein [Deltaproteobacteria bacterium]
MQEEKSITKLEDLIGKKIHVIAFGASYLGTLQKIDYDKGFLVLTDGKDTVFLELERIDSFSQAEDDV